MDRIVRASTLVVFAVLAVVLVVTAYRVLRWVALRIPPLSRAWTRWNASTAESHFSAMSDALRHFDLAGMPAEALRSAGKGIAGEVRLLYQVLTFFIGWGAADLCVQGLKSLYAGHPTEGMRPSALLTAAVLLPILIWAAHYNPTLTRYRFLLLVMSAIRSCEAVASSTSDERHANLRRLDGVCANVSRSISRVHRIHGSLGLFSHRRRAVKASAALVITKLRQAEEQVDTRGDTALTDLATLLVTVANNYAEGKIGQLLPQEQLEGVVAPPNREGLRLAVVVTATAGAVIAGSLLGLSDLAVAVLGCAVAVLVSIVAYGAKSAMARAAELKSLLGF
ncbi:hypothetical protein [Streptomyces sp. NPDC060031]|uniref:hypothetical protein n=1 Tax=Streptomyces sp. NPDC060031 TaxID=3347043 RepID=UPI0036B6B811